MKMYGLLGYPLGHSFSKSYFSELFSKIELPQRPTYLNFELATPDQAQSLIANPEEGLCGLNVTIPYKKLAWQAVTQLDEVARRVGAVNCIKFGAEGQSTGYNTDVIGFRNSLLEFLDGNRVERALILGTGGAAKAVEYVMQELGVRYLSVSRTQGDITYDRLTPEIIEQHRLIINTTPLGMYPQREGFPDLPYQWLGGEHYLYDLVYNPSQTIFMARGLQHGAKVTGGLRMLHLQAEAAWNIWQNR